MFKSETTKFVLAAAALAVGSSASASLLVGSDDGGNCYPFSCFASDGGTRYQQIYSASAFSSAISVDSVSFFRDSAGLMDSATYSISFYTTSTTLGGMSGDANSNLGTLLSAFGTFSISGSMPAELTLDGVDFTYNPALGNLIMDVQVVGLTQSNGYQSFFQADYTGTDVMRAFAYGGSLNANATGALVTRFNTIDGTIPEPSTLLLAGAALLALRLRKRA